MRYGCIGEKLPHSFSKTIHQKIGDYEYALRELAPREVGDFLRERDFCGINVTIPYKETVIPYLDHLSEDARRIGAVNTVVNRGGELYGYNTDLRGMRMLARRAGIGFSGRTVLILGTGGTSKTACALARAEGASGVFRASRTAKDGALSYEEAIRRAGEFEILINTTPCGMFPDIDGAPAVDLSAFPSLLGVIDAVYNPLRTNLILAAGERGIPAAGGLYMLVAQAVAASGLFFDRELSETLTGRVYREVLSEKQNTVLIGLPSSGKTTVGRLLAEKTGKTLVDTDEEITRRTGASPAQLIRGRGIGAFRAIERDVIRDLAARNGIVIATGGGAILAKENVSALKKNGLLYWLDRPVELLTATDDRPLSDSAEKLRALAEERMPLYRAAADVRLDASASPEEIVKTIETGDM